MKKSGNRALRRRVAVMVAPIGAALIWVLVREDAQNLAHAGWADLPVPLMAQALFFMGLGGALAGWLLADLFGRRGVAGWALAGSGGVLATALACLLGVLLGRLPELFGGGLGLADLISLGAALLLPVFAMAGEPLVAGGWVIAIVLTQALAIRTRG
ncbi:MAG: hypothetical protein ACK5JR_14015 [Tropicimonas sp.]|uniref:hypothetical protein n=1 Tax=Tropicimonas sp. TaxID=2067044 RepID=UPI003A86311D